MPILNLDKVKVESKWHEVKTKAAQKCRQAVDWVVQNPEIVAIAGAVVGGAVKVGKGLVRTHNLRKERYCKERYVYDRSLGMYLHTKRKLTNRDFATITARRKNGERLADILNSMRILD